MPELQLKPGKGPRALHGHPWAYASDVKGLLPDAANGKAVELKDSRGKSLGMGLYNGHSQIVWRRYSRDAVKLDAAYLESAIGAAIERRSDDAFRRVVWSEADGLPGLVVDQFADVLVVQLLTLGMDDRRAEIEAALEKHLSPREIIYRNDAPSRQHEGLRMETTTRSGERLPAQWFEIDGVAYYLDLYAGQKTGFYLDQRREHLRIAGLANGRRVLDAFCNQGAFGLQCAKAGAASVLALDISADCIKATKLNAGKNQLTVEAQEANVFDWFTQNRDGQFDLIVLDPPSFARNKKAVAGALRGYKELNLRAMRLLSPGGILASYSCSANVGLNEFLDVAQQAAADAKRDVRLMEITGQPADHPALLNMPESHYLKGMVLEVR
ncbi:class I SAM-dependent rRNA methyltransferase [Cerasicoccus fimbriatus]|uniref:class I SAM-dependent rRNA methyltransferase n=1 Tax=Cerasicoccus fimbriatus TaxID=3014554 RepID=UPI0022B2C05A|nr:class I SAM-dependent rRNA methyltransferase [Cerasicoccus sp. TK19100]